jgi:hypothetical protein
MVAPAARPVARPRRSLVIVGIAGLLLAAVVAAPSVAREETMPAATAGVHTAPTGATPPLPAGLAGDWFSGTLSVVQAYDPISGQWADPNGAGVFLLIDATGAYQEGGVLESIAYSCTIRLRASSQGTLHAEGIQLVLERSGGTTTMTNTCGGDGTYPQEPERLTYRYALDVDASGHETLTLTELDGTPYLAYQRWER